MVATATRAERIQSRLAAVLPELDALFGGEHFDPMTAQEACRLELSDYSVAAFGADLARTIRTESPGSTLAYQLLDDGAFDHLSTGEVDLLILGRPAPTQFSSRLLFTDRFVGAVAADHALVRRRQLSLRDYLRFPHIRIDIERGGQHLIERTLGSPRKVAITTPFTLSHPRCLPAPTSY